MTDETDSGQEAALREGAAVFLGQVLGLNEAAGIPRRRPLADQAGCQRRHFHDPARFVGRPGGVPRLRLRARPPRRRRPDRQGTVRRRASDPATGGPVRNPGPRALAHAESGDYGYILATTPGTYRALVGDADTGAPWRPPNADLLSIQDAQRIRSESAERLLAALKTANEQATQWLEAIRLASQAEATGIDEVLEFNERETELALYLLDEQSIGNLLQALNLLVATAQDHALNALDDSP